MTRRRRLRDARLWIGLLITALALWLTFRDVSWRELASDVARANWWLLLGISLPAHLWALQLRAQRWQVLARGVAEFGSGPALRATAVGFMVNNLLPLRVGEFVRAWWLAREIRASGSALLGTVILERVIDMAFLLVLGSLVIQNDVVVGSLVIPNHVVRSLLFVAAAASLGATFAVRRWPGAAVAGVQRVAARLVPPARAERLAASVASVAAGVAALRGRGDLVRVSLSTALLWAVAAVIPFWATLASLGIDLGGVAGEVAASFTALVYVGAAVAIPSSPGFFGTYHAACLLALTPLGVPRESAVAVGTLAHAVFWLGTTAFGLVAIRLGGRRLGEALASAEQV